MAYYGEDSIRVRVGRCFTCSDGKDLMGPDASVGAAEPVPVYKTRVWPVSLEALIMCHQLFLSFRLVCLLKYEAKHPWGETRVRLRIEIILRIDSCVPKSAFFSAYHSPTSFCRA